MQNTKELCSVFGSWRSSVVEQLTCNQQVGGSTPFASSTAKMQKARCRMQDIGNNLESASCIVSDEGELAEWTMAPDCKSGGATLRRFESSTPQNNFGFRIGDFGGKSSLLKSAIRNLQSAIETAGVAQLARASAFQAEGRGFESRLPLCWCMAHVAQAVEHILGKDVVGGSSPPVGSRFLGVIIN